MTHRPQLEEAASWASALGLALALTPAEDEARRGLHVDWAGRRISIDATPVRLTPMEWKALERLAAAPGELVPHIDLFRHLYGEDEPYRAQSTAIRVLITKLRRLLPPLRIETQWGRGYVISGIASSSSRGTPQAEVAAERPVEPVSPRPDKPRNPVALTPSSIMPDRTVIHRKLVEIPHPGVRRAAVTPTRPNARRADELVSIERFLAERGVTRCPDVATIQLARCRPWCGTRRSANGCGRPPSPARQADPTRVPPRYTRLQPTGFCLLHMPQEFADLSLGEQPDLARSALGFDVSCLPGGAEYERGSGG